MNIKKLSAIILAAVMLLSLWACGKKDDGGINYIQQEQQAIEKAAGTLLLQAGVELTIPYDKDGKVTAIISTTEDATAVDDAYMEYDGKTCAQVVLELVELINVSFSDNLQGFVFVRQEPGSADPSEDFIKTLRTTVAGNTARLPVIVVAADELDADGYIGAATTEAILDAYLGGIEGLTVTYDFGKTESSHSATCTDANGVVTTYLINAVNGAVEVYQESTDPQQEPPLDPNEFSDIIDEDMIPDYELAGEEMPQADLSDYT